MPEPVNLDTLIAIDHLLSEEDKLVRASVRRFVKERYLPVRQSFLPRSSSRRT